MDDTYAQLTAEDSSIDEPSCEPYDDCPLDGDHDSTMESIGWGTDEDYGYFGDEEDW
jgi:hypothetical protein